MIMDNKNIYAGIISQTLTSCRIVIGTITVCCLLYGVIVLSFGQLVAPNSANGSLLYNRQGEVVGSELISQGFSRPEYLWPRPSAVDYNASASGGSNLSPTNPELRSRAQAIIGSMDFSGKTLIPADLLTASGSGLDPHISLNAAQLQSERIAKARSLPITAVRRLFEEFSRRPVGSLTPEPLVNVLLVNLALNRMAERYEH
jgi:K+-transporting ATPase ATPase C chain